MLYEVITNSTTLKGRNTACLMTMTSRPPAKETGMDLNRTSRSLTALFTVSSVFAWSAAAAPLRFAASEAGSRQATLEIQSDELVTMTALPFRLVINHPDGKPLTGVV